MKAPYKIIVSPALVLLVFLSSSCLIVSRHQLIDPHRSKPDKQLRGRWIGTDKLKTVYALFNDGLMETNIFTGKEPVKRSEVLFDVVTGPIGKYQYMSLKPQEESGDGYLLARYAIEGDQLKIWLLDSPLIDAAISQDGLKSTKVAASTTMLTDSPEKIVGFIVKNQDDDLFEYLGSFKREK